MNLLPEVATDCGCLPVDICAKSIIEIEGLEAWLGGYRGGGRVGLPSFCKAENLINSILWLFPPASGIRQATAGSRSCQRKWNPLITPPKHSHLHLGYRQTR